MVDVRWPNLDAVLARVPHDLCWCIETHRLGVQKRGSEYVRIAAFQPGRGINQERKTRRVAFRESVFAEAFDLLETALGEIAFIAIGQHAVDHLALESADGADTFEGCHRAA